jgi:predicted site-specific integrase-resolvase
MLVAHAILSGECAWWQTIAATLCHVSPIVTIVASSEEAGDLSTRVFHCMTSELHLMYGIRRRKYNEVQSIPLKFTEYSCKTQ